MPGASPNGNAPRQISPGFIGRLSVGKFVDVLPRVGQVIVPLAGHALEPIQLRVSSGSDGHYDDHFDPPGWHAIRNDCREVVRFIDLADHANMSHASVLRKNDGSITGFVVPCKPAKKVKKGTR
jgi:hypothetical protein